MLFVLYLLPLGQLIGNVITIFDDIQLYISFRPQDVSKLSVPSICISRMLRLDDTTAKLSVALSILESLGSLPSFVKPAFSNIRVPLSQAFSLDRRVNRLVLSCFFIS